MKAEGAVGVVVAAVDATGGEVVIVTETEMVNVEVTAVSARDLQVETHIAIATDEQGRRHVAHGSVTMIAIEIEKDSLLAETAALHLQHLHNPLTDNHLLAQEHKSLTPTALQ